MCGIVYLKRNDGHSPLKPLLSRYEEQKGRGQNGFGFVAVKDGVVVGYERDTTEAGFLKKLEKYHTATEILGHHRFPTSTENVEEAAHPIFVSNNLLKSDYYFVHNGVIQNPGTLKSEHEKLGFEYNTEIEIFSGYKQKGKKKNKERVRVTKTEFNDSESLAIEFALFNEGIKKEIGTVGSAAFVCYEVNKSNNKVIALHYGHNDGNPLKIFKAHGMMVLSSESKDKGHFDIERYKLLSIYYDKKENKLTQRDMVLEPSFSTKGHVSGRTHGSTGYDSWRYPDYSGGSSDNPSMGFDTTNGQDDDDDEVVGVTVVKTLPPRDDSRVGDHSKDCVCEFCVLFNEATGKEKQDKMFKCRNWGDNTCHNCEHTATIREESKGLCLHGGGNPVTCQQCTDIKLAKKFPKMYPTCSATGYPEVSCDCPMHRVKKIGAEPSMTIKTASRKADELEEDIGQLEYEIDKLTTRKEEIDHSNVAKDIDEWFAIDTKVEGLKRQIDTKNKLLQRCMEFVSGHVF